MKLNKYFMGFLGALAMTACSSEEPAVTGGGTDDATFSDNYMSISIEMPNETGGRADFVPGNGADNYDNGTAEESKVSNIVFFFFDDANNCVDVQKVDNPTFTAPVTLDENPFITRYGTIEVRLKTGLEYKKVAVALNTSVGDALSLKNSIHTLADLEARNLDYVKGIAEDGSKQVMSNSVYYSMDKAADKPTADKKVLLVDIKKENIYDSSERPNIKELIAKGDKKYVDIYVERVVARVDVTVNLKMDDYYIYQEGDKKVDKITIFNHVDMTSREVVIKPVINGMALNVLTTQAFLVKSLDRDDTSVVGYGEGTGNGAYKQFEWNDPINKRSYWGNEYSTKEDKPIDYVSWNDVNKGNITKSEDGKTITGSMSRYIHPNTQDFLPTANNEKNSNNTKVMVVATLCEDGDPEKPISLVRYGADYMTDDNLKAYAAQIANNAVRAIDWTTTDQLPETITEAQRNEIAVSVSKAFETGLIGGLYEINMANTDSMKDAWNALVTITGISSDAETDAYGSTYTLTDLDATLEAAAKAVINPLIEGALDEINKQTILYWKGGKTYFYTNIRQQGFIGLVGNGADNWLNGVVRNHIYKINLTGIFGLGTPVIEPGKPIDPERPDDERPSYIQARINVLPWRIVENNATIH